MTLLAVDLECTGQDLNKHNIISIGAAVIDWREEKVVERFQVYFSDEFVWDPDTKTWWESQDKYADTLKKAKETGFCHDKAINKFRTWIKKFKDSVIITDNPSFDIMWLNYHLEEPMHMIFGEYRDVVDVTSYYAGIGLRFSENSNGELSGQENYALKQLNITPPDAPHTHNSLDDAIHIGLTHARVLKAVHQIRSVLKKHQLSIADVVNSL